MTERSWCPSSDTQACVRGVPSFKCIGLENSEHGGRDPFSAERDACVAANSSVSANEIAESLTVSFQRRFRRFDAALVCSNANRSLWCPHFGEFKPLAEDSVVGEGAAVCLDVGSIGRTPIHASELAIPSNNLDDFLSLVARRSAESKGLSASVSVARLIALPCTDTVASLGDILGSLMSSKPVVEQLSGFLVCGASSAKTDTVLAEFLSAATKLEELSLVNCSLENTIIPLMEALTSTEMQRLSLDRSNIGFSSADTDFEGLTHSFCEAVKVSKFLTSLNLSNTNLNVNFVVALIDALIESDTKLLPEDLGEDAAEDIEWSLEGRLNKAAFLGGRDPDDSSASLADSATVSDDGEDATSSPGSSESDEENSVSDNESEEEVGDDAGDEDASEGEEGGEEEEDTEDDEEEAIQRAKDQRQRARKEKREREAQQRHFQKQLRAFLRGEVQARSALAHEYCRELQSLVTVNSDAIADRRATERQQKKEAYCSRRSGWSRLETLILRGNQVGDRGCKKLSYALRDEVPLSAEEVVERQQAMDAIWDGLGEEIGAARSAVVRGEKKARQALLQMVQRESLVLAPAHSTSISAALSDSGDEDEYAKEAPPVLLTNVEQPPGGSSALDDNPGSDSDADTDADASSDLSPEEKKEWQEWVAQALPHPPVAHTKKGMNTLRVIDLGSCNIERKGLKALAEVLKTNKVLETLSLRHNTIGSRAPAKRHQHTEDDLSISPEFAEFSEMLSTNRALCHLDIGYCHLGPNDVRALAKALCQNSSMVTLNLEGNQLSVDEAYQQQKHAHSYLYDLWMTVARPGSALRNLNMDHNDLAACLWQEEVAALAAVCGQLTSLSLSHVSLQLRHLQAWSQALPLPDMSYSPTVRILHLARNEFVSEVDGAALGLLLQHFTALEELSLEGHPLLGSSGMAAALEYLPTTMRRLNCTATGLTTPWVGAAQNPVFPVAVAKQLKCLLLGDVEASTVDAIGEWVAFLKTTAPQKLQFLSLWARGMSGKEVDVMPPLLDLAQACPSLLHVDSGFQPYFHISTFASSCFEEMELLLFPRRMQFAALQSEI
ncbi:hypothetical protein JKF63_02405 [Porcisia hertigi]|uniref:Uncharacterized protein n=1 Tax=Porcisia hertigi TaxID=2761500 RepID=A0A836IIK4_9TRYP|nr:hypothetical protein JKF63_02405 [Porcisia hertigi]